MSIEKKLRGELIGIEVEVGGIKGTIIDETKNIFVVKQDTKRKKVAKKNNEFIFKFPEFRARIEGNIIALRPEDRVKMKLPRKWKSKILD